LGCSEVIVEWPHFASSEYRRVLRYNPPCIDRYQSWQYLSTPGSAAEPCLLFHDPPTVYVQTIFRSNDMAPNSGVKELGFRYSRIKVSTSGHQPQPQRSWELLNC
ncbi:hypothetical protein J6590_017173, partial [Homalodisca vitripennis]